MSDKSSPRPRKRRWKKLVVPTTEPTSRRRFVAQGAAMLAGGVVLLSTRLRTSGWAMETDRVPVRPPTASLDDATFRSKCIGCGMCGTVCENGCIRYFAADETTWGPLTPFVDVRRRSCTLCMRCTQICPTDALTPVEHDMEVIVEAVDMGLAVVDPDRCLSYLGRVCGYCHDACPLPEKAIKLMPPAKPVVLADGCVGCGRCVENCPQFPTAIDVAKTGKGVSS